MMILVFAFTGFEISTINAGEVSDPRRNFPFSMLIVLLFVVIIYILVQIICIGTLPELAGSESPLADAAYHFVGPMAALAFIICIWLLSHSTANEIIQLVIAISVGFVLYMTSRLKRT